MSENIEISQSDCKTLDIQENDFFDLSDTNSLYSLVVISIFTCIFGILGNFLVLFVISTLKEYKKSATHWYILQLAIADSLFLLTIPFKISEDLNKAWVYPEWICKIKKTILYFNYYASTLFLIVMSLDRYIAVCKPFSTSWQKLRKQKSAFIISFVLWVVAFLLTIPVIMYSFKTGQEPYCICAYDITAGVEKNNFDKVFTYEWLMNSSVDDNLNVYDYLSSHCHPSNDWEYSGFSESVDGFDLDTFVNYEKFYGGNLSIFIPPVDIYDGLSYGKKSNSVMNKKPACFLAPNCHYNEESSIFVAMLVFDAVIMFLLPVLIMLACYGLIVARLIASGRSLSQNALTLKSTSPTMKEKPFRRRTFSSTSSRDRKRVTFMCAALVSTFIICWLPYYSLQVGRIIGIRNTKNEVCLTFTEVTALLAFMNSALNPYIYSFLGTSFFRRLSVATSSVKKSIARSIQSRSGNIKSSPRQPAKTRSVFDQSESFKFARKQADRKNAASDSVQSC